MKPIGLYIVAGILVGCAGHGAPSAPAVPVPAATPDGAPGSEVLTAPSDYRAEAAAKDSAARLRVADSISHEQRLAADSAADAEILEQLANARPEHGDSNEEAAESSVATGGANAVAAPAVTWDIDVATYNSHDRVQYYLDFFQGTARERMAIWLTRMPLYESMIRQHLRQHRLPEDMVYLALIESGYSNSAVSRSRAVGMWQFIKGTAKGYGLRIDRWVDERRDPFKATEAAARHLSDLRDRFGSVYLAAAAYNAGAGKVGRGLRRLPGEEEDTLNADASFFRLYDTKFLRRETKDYVPKLIAAALIAKQPEKYGFARAAGIGPLTVDSIIVPDMTGLDVIARLADTTLAAIRDLNPQFLRQVTPPNSRSVVRLPAGKGADVAAAYAELPVRERLTFREHFVERGETLGQIARDFHISTSDLLAANPSLKPKSLKTGQRVVIPINGVAPSTAARRAVDDPQPGSAATTAGGIYRVRSGESLWSLSQQFGVTIAQLRAWNGLDQNDQLKVGQRVRVSQADSPAVEAESPAVAAAAPAKVHVVRRGETLSDLARRYGVDLQALKAANGLKDEDVIRVGVRLKIPS